MALVPAKGHVDAGTQGTKIGSGLHQLAISAATLVSQ
jgi:hypothetical protein